MNLVSIVHFILSVFMAIYAFIINKSQYDIYYICITLLILLSWLIYNGECYVTYLFKKTKNPNYIAGSQSIDLDDMNICGDKICSRYFFFALMIVNICSVGLVLHRNKYLSEYTIYLFLLLYLILILILRKFYLSDSTFKYYHLDVFFEYFKIIFGIFILYVFYSLFYQSKLYKNTRIYL
jgi:hypothetical protein